MNYQRFEDEIPANKNPKKSEVHDKPLLLEEGKKEIELAQVFLFLTSLILKLMLNFNILSSFIFVAKQRECPTGGWEFRSRPWSKTERLSARPQDPQQKKGNFYSRRPKTPEKGKPEERRESHSKKSYFQDICLFNLRFLNCCGLCIHIKIPGLYNR